MPRKDGREALQEIKARPEAPEHPRRHPDHLQGRGGHLPHLRPVGRLVHHQAGDVRGAGGRRQDARASTGSKSWSCRTNGDDRRPADRPVRVLLVDDDEDDYLLTRDLLAEIPGERVPAGLGRRLRRPGSTAVCAGEHDVYLLDYRLGAKTGLELLREAQRARLLAAGHPADRPGAVARSTWRRWRPGPPTTWRRAGSTPPLLERSIRYAIRAAARPRPSWSGRSRANGPRNWPQANAGACARPTAARTSSWRRSAHELPQPAGPDPQRPGDHAAGAGDTGDTVAPAARDD